MKRQKFVTVGRSRYVSSSQNSSAKSVHLRPSMARVMVSPSGTTEPRHVSFGVAESPSASARLWLGDRGEAVAPKTHN